MAPLFNWFSLGSYQLVDYFVQQNVLPFIHIIVEPLKVLFFNNIVNHGLFTPLGIEAAALNGQSVLFLIEANPGPGLGVLAAYLFWFKAKPNECRSIRFCAGYWWDS